MPTRNLSSMSVDALLKLRADIEKTLSSRAAQLRNELSKLGHGDVSKIRSLVGGSPLKGRKAPIKYRDRSGNTWAGRGQKPRWLVAAIKRGKKLDDFLIDKSARKRTKGVKR
jgi:DNA-binding protein H-NS